MIAVSLLLIALTCAALSMGSAAVGWITLETAESLFRRAMLLYVFSLIGLVVEYFI